VKEADKYVALGSRHFIESGFDTALESFAKAGLSLPRVSDWLHGYWLPSMGCHSRVSDWF
jgi:hypothetical protein